LRPSTKKIGVSIFLFMMVSIIFIGNGTNLYRGPFIPPEIALCDPCGCKEFFGYPIKFYEPVFCEEFKEFYKPMNFNIFSLIADLFFWYSASCLIFLTYKK